MYKVMLDDEILSWHQLEETALLSANLAMEANKAGSFTFSMAPNHPCYDKIALRTSLIDVYQDDELIWSGTPISESTNFWNVKTVVCEGDLAFLNDTIQRPVNITGDAATYLASVLTNHNAQAGANRQFNIGAVTVMENVSKLSNYKSSMKAIADNLVNDLGGYLQIRRIDTATWEYPVQVGDVLYITQVYDAEQTDDVLRLE